MNLIGGPGGRCRSMDIEQDDTIIELMISYDSFGVNYVKFKTKNGESMSIGKKGNRDRISYSNFDADNQYAFFGLIGTGQDEVSSLGVLRYGKVCYYQKQLEMGDNFTWNSIIDCCNDAEVELEANSINDKKSEA